MTREYFLPDGERFCSTSDLLSPHGAVHEVCDIWVLDEGAGLVSIELNNRQKRLQLNELVGWEVKQFDRFRDEDD